VNISVTEPVGPAIERTKAMLFRPFDAGKWFTLGFCAWLALLGEGGAQANYRTGSGDHWTRTDFDHALNWVLANWILLLVLVTVALLLWMAVTLLVWWLSSRGQFMFIDGIVHNRGAVKAPWHEFRREGNSLFWFRFWFDAAVTTGGMLLLLLGLLIALPDLRDLEFTWSSGIALLICAPLFILWALAATVINMFLFDFVVPIMYLRRIPALLAWSVFRRELLAGRGGTFALYVLFKIVIAIAVGFLALGVLCCTCCIAALPYLGTVIMLPLWVFLRAYTLYFLEQFGPEWRFFEAIHCGDAERISQDRKSVV
jgi:hypothetical protein